MDIAQFSDTVRKRLAFESHRFSENESSQVSHRCEIGCEVLF